MRIEKCDEIQFAGEKNASIGAVNKLYSDIQMNLTFLSVI